MTVVPGPGFGGRRVVQSAEVEGWWYRDERGALWIRCPSSPRWWPAPVPESEGAVPDSRPNPRRITSALDLRGLDGPEVDEALGVANALDTVVDSWETGAEVPSSVEIRRLAFLTGFAPSWFFGEDPIDLGHVFICRR